MTSVIVVAVLWAAAIYRVVLSVRRGPTLWRTSFTVCVVAVAVASFTALYGDQTINVGSGVANLALLMTRLALICAAAASAIYIAALRRDTVTARDLQVRVAVAMTFILLELAAWASAPIHDHDIPTSTIDQSSTAGLVFLLVFLLAIFLATVESARFFLSRAARRGDPVRTICVSFIGAGCALAALTVVLGGIGAVLHRARSTDMAAFADLVNYILYASAVGIALGVLSLLVAPPVRELLVSYARWRALRPLWADLVRLRPEVRLDIPVSGSPLRRLRVHLQRRVVEVYDALRVIPVSVPENVTVDELAQALHYTGGTRMAAEVLHEASGRADHGDDDGAVLVALARTYAHERR